MTMSRSHCELVHSDATSAFCGRLRNALSVCGPAIGARDRLSILGDTRYRAAHVVVLFAVVGARQ